MTRRKTTQKQPTQAPTEAVEGVKAESKAKVASKPKTATKALQKTPSNPRGRPKKVVAQKSVVPEGKVVSEVTYVAPNRTILVSEPPPSLYDRFVDWATQKLFTVTYMFRGY